MMSMTPPIDYPDYTVMNEPSRTTQYASVQLSNPYDSEEEDIFKFLCNPSTQPHSLPASTMTTNNGSLAAATFCQSPKSPSPDSDDSRDDSHQTQPRRASTGSALNLTKTDVSVKGEDADLSGGEDDDLMDDEELELESTPKGSKPSAQAGSDKPKGKKRCRATPEQLAILEEVFVTNTSPNSKIREQLAEKVNMTERSVQIWFQNRRAKVKTIQKRAYKLQEDAMKNQYMGGGLPGQMYPFRQSMMQQNGHAMGRIPLPRRFSDQMVNKAPMIPTMRTITPPPNFPSHHQNMGLISVPGMWAQTMSGQTMMASPYGYVQVGMQPFPSPSYSPMSSRSVSPISSRTMSPIPVSGHHSHPLDSYQPIELRPPHAVDIEQSSFSSPGANVPVPAPNDSAQLFSVDTLCIGSWRRMALNPSDLRCYYNITDRQMSWHISDHTSHFKMEFSFEAITSLEFVMVDGIFAQIFVELNESPVFFMENTKERTGSDGKAPNLTWTQCSDFTEGKQASRFFKHSMKGLAQPLMQQILDITAADVTMHKVTKIVEQTHAPQVVAHKPMIPPHLNYQRRHSYDNFRYMPMMARPAPGHSNRTAGRRAASVPDVKSSASENGSSVPAPVQFTAPVTEIIPATPTSVEFSPAIHMNASAATLSTYRTARGPHGTSPLSHVSAPETDDTDAYSDMSGASTPAVMYQEEGQHMEMHMWAGQSAYGEPQMMMDSMMNDSMMMAPPMMHPSDAGMGMATEYAYVDGQYFSLDGQEHQVVIGEDGTHYLEH